MKYLRVDKYQSKKGLRTFLDHPGFPHVSMFWKPKIIVRELYK
jgi:hypothetical protein